MKLSGTRIRTLLHLTALIAGLMVAPAAVHGQPALQWDPNHLEVTRAGLEEMLAQHERVAASSESTPQARQEASAAAESIRLRLREGDFRPGDEIDLRVEGESALQGAFVVNAERAIILPVFGAIPLEGVLRSELQETIRSKLAGYLINPVVSARSSIRLLISGTVAQPGIYVVPTQQLLSAFIMDSGRPGAQADIRGMRIERGDTIIWDKKRLESAVALGYSVDQLGLRSGDHIFIPPREEGGFGRLGRLAAGIPAVLIAVASLARLF